MWQPVISKSAATRNPSFAGSSEEGCPATGDLAEHGAQHVLARRGSLSYNQNELQPSRIGSVVRLDDTL
jgi:hypothetical protein